MTTVPSDTVLDETPARALKFLGAISINPIIFAALAQRGYSEAEHDKGWQLVLKASGYRQPGISAPIRPGAATAMVEVDNWDEPNFRVARVSLAEFPEQRDFVFADLEAQTGVAAVVSVTTFLDRLDDLESAKDRKATRKVDHAALAKLSERGITSDERTRLRGLLAAATASPDPAAAAPKPAETDAAQARREAKLALRIFYEEWSEIARVVIKRRDHLIQLGLMKRKVKKKKGSKTEEPTGEGGEK